MEPYEKQAREMATIARRLATNDIGKLEFDKVVELAVEYKTREYMENCSMDDLLDIILEDRKLIEWYHTIAGSSAL